MTFVNVPGRSLAAEHFSPIFTDRLIKLSSHLIRNCYWNDYFHSFHFDKSVIVSRDDDDDDDAFALKMLHRNGDDIGRFRYYGDPTSSIAAVIE